MQAFNLFCRSSVCDLTGTSVIADKPIGVFAGGRGRVPSNVAYTDHMEEHLIPRQKWGTSYIVPKSRDRWGTEDRIRIMADQDDTTVQFNPEINVTLTLQEGEWAEVSVFEPVIIDADKPIQVGQYLVGSQHGDYPGGVASEGDPSFWMVPPTEQFRSDYVFYVPATYTSDYLAIMYQGNPEIVLDGVVLNVGSPDANNNDAGIMIADAGSGDAGTMVDAGPAMEPVAPGTDYYVMEVLIDDGAHVLKASVPIGLIIYGFGGPSDLDPNGVQNVSYGYVGGLNLVTINPKD